MNVRTIFKNPDIFFSLLTVLIFVFYIFNSEFVSISVVTFLHFFIFSIMFAFSYRYHRIFFSTINIRIKPFVRKEFIYFLALTTTLYSLYKLLVLLMSNDLASLMMFRGSVSGDDAKVLLGVGLSFPFTLAAWYITKNHNNNLSSLFFLLAIMLAIISTTKIFLFILVFYSLYFSNVSVSKVIFSLLILIALFFLSHLLLEKFSSNPEDGLFVALWNTFLVYLYGGIAGFENLLNNKIEINEFTMFKSIEGLVSIFGFYNLPDTAILPWTRIGVWNTNVYTAFGYWYALMGYFYLFIAPLILGAYYAFFFTKSEVSNHFEFYKPFLYFCLAFIYMGDQFIPAITMHLIYIFTSTIVSVTKK